MVFTSLVEKQQRKIEIQDKISTTVDDAVTNMDGIVSDALIIDMLALRIIDLETRVRYLSPETDHQKLSWDSVKLDMDMLST